MIEWDCLPPVDDEERPARREVLWGQFGSLRELAEKQAGRLDVTPCRPLAGVDLWTALSDARQASLRANDDLWRH